MKYKRIVIKLGTSTLTSGTRNISLPGLLELVKQVSSLHLNGSQIILVSSGAIAAGREALNQPALGKHIPAKQMLAAVGQSRLMEIYNKLFQMYDIPVGQVLLTREDLLNRRRYLNARNTLEALLTYHVIPVINENDTVATEEIRFGDNDNLSALVASLVEADLLVLLTDQDGFYTGDPKQSSSVNLVSKVTGPEIPPEIWAAAGKSSSSLGTGGMVTKLHAADLARRSGITVVIANGRHPENLPAIAEGESVGSWFLPVITSLESRKRFLLASEGAVNGSLRIDGGAAQALRRGGSLLPVGLKEIEGSFHRGDLVKVVTLKSVDLALGSVNYNHADLARIAGKRSSEIETLLGYSFGDEVIHHNNMMLY
jgi:glutamate 5-kinase